MAGCVFDALPSFGENLGRYHALDLEGFLLGDGDHLLCRHIHGDHRLFGLGHHDRFVDDSVVRLLHGLRCHVVLRHHDFVVYVT